MADKVVRNVDGEIWRKFTGFCKIKNVKVGEELTKILKKYLKGKI